MKKCIDPLKLNSGGLVTFKTSGKVCHEDLKNELIGQLAEGMLQSYPGERDPSGYLLGDAVMILNGMLSDVILGSYSTNPITEKSRRDKALREGTNLKILLSYVRASSNRTEKGRSAGVTYLKELALQGREARKRSRASNASSASSREDLESPRPLQSESQSRLNGACKWG